jgi:hypothetical protein
MVSLLTINSFAGDKKKGQAERDQILISQFPEPVLQQIYGDRFRNPEYFSLFLLDGIRTADPKSVYNRQKAAVEANETYKAMFFARIFTDLKPELSAAWSNRGALAATLGLKDEAAACQANAEHPTQRMAVPKSILPHYGVSVRPSSLSDWAAALQLMSDGLQAREGDHTLLAVRDDVSGINVASPAEVEAANKTSAEVELPRVGPWATAKPVGLEHVLPNAFSLRSAEPMSHKTVNKGGMFAAMLMGGLAGLSKDPAASAQVSQAAGELAGRATQVSSEYQGGAYTFATYDDGKESVANLAPKPTGETQTVGSPFPILWAAGQTGSASYLAQLAQKDKSWVQVWAPAGPKEVKAKAMKLPDKLYMPKLMTLCTGYETCTPPLSLNELLFTKEDVAALAPSLIGEVMRLDEARGR